MKNRWNQLLVGAIAVLAAAFGGMKYQQHKIDAADDLALAEIRTLEDEGKFLAAAEKRVELSRAVLARCKTPGSAALAEKNLAEAEAELRRITDRAAEMMKLQVRARLAAETGQDPGPAPR